MKKAKPKVCIGWREWASLPELGIDRIKVKVDTGAQTSSLQALKINIVNRDGERFVHFEVHPDPKNNDKVIYCEAPFIEKRHIKNSGGTVTKRCVIRTPIQMGEFQYSIELTLIDRRKMKHRMLLGRRAIKPRFLVDVSTSFLISK